MFDLARGGPQWGVDGLVRAPLAQWECAWRAAQALPLAGAASDGSMRCCAGHRPATRTCHGRHGWARLADAGVSPTWLRKHCRNSAVAQNPYSRAREQPPLTRAQGAGNLRAAKSRLGLGYAALPDGRTSLLGNGAAAAQLAEVEAYFSPAIAALC